MAHDLIYSLLAIARDAAPIVRAEESSLGCIQPIFETLSQRKRYKVEYEKPFADVAGDLSNFASKARSLWTRLGHWISSADHGHRKSSQHGKSEVSKGGTKSSAKELQGLISGPFPNHS